MAGMLRSTVLVAMTLSVVAVEALANCSIRYGLGEGGFDYDPVSSFKRSQDTLISNHLAHSLLTLHTDGSTVLRGAQDFRIDAETQQIHVSLDPSCKWEDAQPVTSYDFAEGLRYSLSLSAIENLASISKRLDPATGAYEFAIDTPNETTLIIGYQGSSEALLPFLGTAMPAPLPTHKVSSGDAYYALPLQDRLHAGPYTVAAAEDNRLRFVRNPHYCAALRPTISSVIMQSFATDEERVWAFVRGELDVMRHVSHKQLQSVQERRQDVDLNFVPMGVPGITALMLNPSVNGLEVPKVRQAVALALDYRGFIDRGIENPSLTREYSKGYVARIGGRENPYLDPAEIVRTDPFRARMIMEDLGYSADNRLSLTITTYPLAKYETAARLVASMLSRAHFDVTFTPQDSIEAAIETNFSGQYESFVFGYTLGFADNLYGLQAYFDDQLMPIIRDLEAKGADVPPDLIQLRQELEHLLTLIGEQSDPEKRNDHIDLAEARIGASGTLVPLYGTEWNLVSRSNLRPVAEGFAVPHGHSAQYWLNSDCGE